MTKKIKPVLKKGSIVNIYEDPNTKRYLDGKAKLINYQTTFQGMVESEVYEVWDVQFTEREGYFDEGFYTRTILVNPKQKPKKEKAK